VFDWRYLTLPPIGAVIGWLTNRIAIKMLFRPHRPVRVLGMTFQGLLPRRRREFALSIAKTVERDLLTAEEITRFLEEVRWEEEVERAVEGSLEKRLKDKRIRLLLKAPLFGLIGREVIRQAKGVLTRTIIEKIREHKGPLVEKFQESLAVEEIVTRKVEGFDMEKLESLLMELIAQELAYIEWVGAALGFLIGLAQMVLLLLLKNFH